MSRLPSFLMRYGQPLLGLLVGLSMTTAAWAYIRNEEAQRSQARFLADAAYLQSRIALRMERHGQVIAAAAAFLAQQPVLPDREAWRRYVQSLDLGRNDQGVQGLGFARWIPTAALAAHVRRMRAEGFPRYEVIPGGPLPPEGGISSILYLEPGDERNRQAFFRDMLAEPVRREALHRARDTGETVLSGKVQLFQEFSTNVQAGTLLFAPVYRRGAPLGTVPERRQALLGWTYMAFRMQDLMSAILAAPGAPQIGLELFDGASAWDGDRMISLGSLGSDTPALGTEQRLNVAGRVWTLRTRPLSGAGVSFGRTGHLSILLLGALASGAVFLLLNSLARAKQGEASLAEARLGRLQALMASTDEAIYGMDRTGACLFCNAACVRLLGYEHEAQLLGQNMNRLVGIGLRGSCEACERPCNGLQWPALEHRGAGKTSRSVLEPVPEAVQPPVAGPCDVFQALSHGGGITMQGARLRRADGSDFPAQYSTHLLYSGDEVAGLIVTLRDTTRLEQAEASRLDLESRLAYALEASGEGIWDWNLSLDRARHNARWCQILGLDESYIEHPNDFFASKIVEEDRPGVLAKVAATLAHGTPFLSQHRMRHETGKLIWVLDRGKVVEWDLEGRPIRMVGAMTDITENVDANARLLEERNRANQLARPAEKATQATSEFLANMSHEIRTPMNGILGMLNLLLMSPLDAKQSRQAELAHASGKALLEIINDILDLSKIEAGKFELKRADFDLRALLDELHASFQLSARAKGLDLSFTVQPDTREQLCGDATRLRQVLTNLIGNAIKFTDAGAVTLQVGLVALAEQETLLRFSVKDTGIGIAAAHLESIFDNFTQVDSSSTRLHRGTGLGLAISRRITGLMGGEIGVTSEAGKGSEFWFTARLGLQPRNQHGSPAQEQSCSRPNPQLAGARILLAEDNGVNVECAVALLDMWGVQVTVAADGQEALAALRRQAFDLVLMDVQMPVMDGLTATATLRKPASGVLNPQIPVVAMTAHAMTEDREWCLAAGMDDYLSKPIEPTLLLEALQRHLPVLGVPPVASNRPAPAGAMAREAPFPAFDSEDFVGRLMGNQKAAAEILQTFLVAAPTILTQIENAATVPDPQVVGQLLHSLAGSSVTVGGRGLFLQAQKLEQTLLAGDLASLAAGLPILLDEFERFSEAAHAFVT